MTLTEHSPDIISHIISFLDNKSNISLVSTCNTLRKHGQKHGYITSISANKLTMKEFMCMSNSHSKTITTIKFNGFKNPHLCCPMFTKRMIFERCSFDTYLDPGKYSKNTKYIKITDYHRYNNKSTLHINWKSFPNLEEIQLYVHNVDITNIGLCTKLKKVDINTSVYKVVEQKKLSVIFGISKYCPVKRIKL